MWSNYSVSGYLHNYLHDAVLCLDHNHNCVACLMGFTIRPSVSQTISLLVLTWFCSVLSSNTNFWFLHQMKSRLRKSIWWRTNFKTSSHNIYHSQVPLLFRRWHLVLHCATIPNSLSTEVITNSRSYLTLCKSDLGLCQYWVLLRTGCFSSLLSNC